MARCAGLTRSGDQCTSAATAGGRFCYLHDPAREDERKRNASKAAKSKGNTELGELKEELRQLFRDIKAGRGDVKRASVCAQIGNTLLRALALEKDLREQEEIIARIERLEEIV